MSTEVVGYTDKGKRDERYAQLKHPAQAARGLVKFSEIERLGPEPSKPRQELRRFPERKGYHTVLVRDPPQKKSKWRTLWCVAWSG